MPGLRSLRNRLAVVFGLIVLGAIATMYIAVTPLLEERLTEQKLNGLVEDGRRYVEGPAGFAELYRTGSESPARRRAGSTPPRRARAPRCWSSARSPAAPRR